MVIEKKKAIAVSLREANLKRRLRRHLRSVGFKKGVGGNLETAEGGKDVIRFLHHAQRNDLIKSNKSFITGNFAELSKYFAAGADVDPSLIKPQLERVKSDTWQSDLFRFAALTWAVPVSNGFGRRLR